MKPNRLIICVLSVWMFVPANASAQQPSVKRTPQLTTEDVKESGASAVKLAPVSRSTGESVNWKRYAPQELALSIELPGKPLLMGLSFPDLIGQGMSPASAYSYQSEQISVFVLRFLSRKPTVSVSELRSFAAGFLDGSAKRPGISDVENLTKQQDDSTVMLKGTYREGSVMFETRGFVHARGSDFWLIATRFAQAEESGAAISVRIINSVKID